MSILEIGFWLFALAAGSLTFAALVQCLSDRLCQAIGGKEETK